MSDAGDQRSEEDVATQLTKVTKSMGSSMVMLLQYGLLIDAEDMVGYLHSASLDSRKASIWLQRKMSSTIAKWRIFWITN
jgi:hypothetical protein